MLEVSELRCERNGRVLFEALSFRVLSGELLRVEGGNGTGKTTLLRSLAGLYIDIEGSIAWDLPDYPLYVSHRPGVKDALTALENLAWLCELYGQPQPTAELRRALGEVGLARHEKRLAGNLSEGQRKRVNLARLALIDSPAWILDEPYSAIDKQGVAWLNERVEAQLERGGLAILTSHQPVETRAQTTTLSLGQ